MKAMILAAGDGKRLRPLTLQVPKALLPLGGVPLIAYTLAWLGRHCISEVAINVCHLGHKIRRFVGDGSQFGVSVVYSEEDSLLGTAGGVRKMRHFFDGPFVVAYGDNLTDFDLSAMVLFHKRKGATATLAAFESPNPTAVGMMEIDEDGRVLGLVEKPNVRVAARQSPASAMMSLGLANAAVYVLEPEVLRHIPDGRVSDFAYDILPKLIESGASVYGYQLRSDDYFIDIGTRENLRRANEDVKTGRVRVEIEHVE